MVDERLGFARAEVSSARELTEPQRARPERATGAPHRQAHSHAFAVDAALIGGVVARIGSTVYDGSRARPVADAGAPPEQRKR